MNPICTYYAIRRKGTYLFLPACDRGATHTEPVDCTVFPMRLFKKRSQANQAMRCWVRGKWVTKYSPSTGEYTGLEVERAPGRDIKDMEVVQVHLRLNQSDMI